MTVFHLLRHGEHGLLGRVLAGRMPGVGMTERGRAEIAAAAERFAREKIAAIYASPLQRTRESAEIVAERLGLLIAFRDDLLELDFGEWTGATFDSIRGHPGWHAWNTQRSLARIPGGESMREVQHRAERERERRHDRSARQRRRAPLAQPVADQQVRRHGGERQRGHDPQHRQGHGVSP